MKKSLFNFENKDGKTTGALEEEQKPVMTAEEEDAIRSGKKTATSDSIDPSESSKSEWDDEVIAAWRASAGEEFMELVDHLKSFHEKYPALAANKDWVKWYQFMKKGFDSIKSGPVYAEDMQEWDKAIKVTTVKVMDPEMLARWIRKMCENPPEAYTNSEEKLKMFNDAKPKLESILEGIDLFLNGKGEKPDQEKIMRELKELFSYMKR